MNQQEAVRQVLQAIAERNGGRITADEVVAAARHPESPLHDLFEWDAGKAAMEHWRERARQIIRSVKVIVRTDVTTVRTVGYLRDPERESDEQGYRSIAAIRTDADLAREVCVAEFSRAAAALRRAKDIAAALGVGDEIDTLIEGVETIRARVAPEQTSASA